MSYLDKQERLELEFESLVETLHHLKDSREDASESANELLTEYIANGIHETLVEICKTSRALCELTGPEPQIGFHVIKGDPDRIGYGREGGPRT